MKFCSDCGAPVEERIPADDNRLRHVCAGCGVVHYVNPKAVVGCLVEHEDGLLLCRRAIEPKPGLWTVPAGYLEVDESAASGAVRETLEEACARVEVVAPYAHFDLPHIGQHYVLFRARMLTPDYGVGPESSEVRVFGLDELPWDEFAFPVMNVALELYREDRRTSRPRVHHGVLRWSGIGSRYDRRNYELEGHMGLFVDERD
ncbi:MAG: NUDIX hydrolase [bacterium]|nr:NUDIX hydrolase [bacterium]